MRAALVEHDAHANPVAGPVGLLVDLDQEMHGADALPGMLRQVGGVVDAVEAGMDRLLVTRDTPEKLLLEGLVLRRSAGAGSDARARDCSGESGQQGNEVAIDRHGAPLKDSERSWSARAESRTYGAKVSSNRVRLSNCPSVVRPDCGSYWLWP